MRNAEGAPVNKGWRTKLLLAILTAALISAVTTVIYWLSRQQLGNVAQVGMTIFLSTLTVILTAINFAANHRR